MQCPKCNKEGKKGKEWSYKPKTRPGPEMHVTTYECSSGHKWRDIKQVGYS